MAGQSLDDERQKSAREYARLRRRLFFFELGVGISFILVLLLSPLSIGLRNVLDFPQPARVALYFTILMFSYGILCAPLDFYRGFVLPRRFGLARQGLRGWLWDEVKAGALGFFLGVGFMVLLYWLLGSFPQLWWLVAGAILLLFTVAMTHLAPIIVVPLFYKLEPLADAELRERLLGLAQRAGTKVVGVFTINLSSKATTANAALMGLGNTRRIVIGDTVLEGYSAEEIEVIMAHELGHHIDRHIWRLIAFQSVVIVLGFYIAYLVLEFAAVPLGFLGVADVAAFPLLALALGAFAIAVRPLANAYSRYLEGAADEYALALTDNAEGFKAVMTKLTNQNLSEARPSRWVELFFYDHPPYWQRMERAQRYEERTEGAG